MILVAAILMLAVWAFFTFTGTAPGWIHALLTFGVFLIIYHVVRSDKKRPPGNAGRKD